MFLTDIFSSFKPKPTGRTIPLFGKLTEIEECTVNFAGDTYELPGKTVRLYLYPGAKKKDRQAIINRLYTDKLRTFLDYFIAIWSIRLNEGPVKYSIRDMRTEWGSCTKATRKMRFNLQLAKTPPECIEYVIVHEMSHLVELNHGPAFKALMDSRMPDWEDRKNKLNATVCG